MMLKKIEINKELDYEVYEAFRDFTIGGVDFGAKIKKDHPLITPDNYIEYIDNFYEDNQRILDKNCRELNKRITKLQPAFLKAVSYIFKINSITNIYKGCLSIFNCNPRYLDSKSFQIYFRKNLLEKIEVVFHEILHFVFFNYCDKYLAEEIKGFNKNSGKMWELSEIVNVIILNLPEFQVVLRRKEKLFYPELEKKLAIVKDIWDKNKEDMREFIKESMLRID